MYQQSPRTRARARLRSLLPLLGPAFVTAVAYVDPGNFATNVTAGARYGYLLVWVVVVSDLVAMLVQYLSAKAGIATGLSLPALCRQQLPRPVVLGLWVQGEVVAVATDLAEVVGGALALQLLFGLPLVVGGLLTAVVAFAMLALRRRGHRPFEVAVTGLLAVILLGFVYAVVRSGADPGAVVRGVVPRLRGSDSLLLATGMLGATVMPHAIYLHGALTSELAGGASPVRRRRLVAAQRTDVLLAMTVAGLMNLALVVVAAATLHHGAHPASTIGAAHRALGTSLGAGAALLFALGLLASGLAASSVGTLAGQVVMEGFLRRSVPVAVRRLASLVPAVVVLALGVDPTRALVGSQVVLSFGIPFAIVPLVLFTRRADLMGELVNRRSTTIAAAAASVLVVGLNVVLVVTTL